MDARTYTTGALDAPEVQAQLVEPVVKLKKNKPGKLTLIIQQNRMQLDSTIRVYIP